MGLLLIVLNLRGMKESIKVLLPIFIGFCHATHCSSATASMPTPKAA